MALAPARRQRLSEVNSDGVKYFMEKLLVQIYEHFDEQELTDVTFKLTNPTALVTAHRLILSSASPYFRQLFKSDEGTCPIIELNNIDSDIFERLITFCYTGYALITMDNVERMLKAAVILKLKDAISNCVDFLIDHVNDYTLERLYSIENEIQCEMLKQKILEYELENFTEDENSAPIFQYDKTDDSWLKWFDIKVDDNFPRVIQMDDNLFFIGDQQNKSWNFKTKTFKEIPPLNESRCRHCVVLLNGEIYAIGGNGSDDKTLRSVEKYTEFNGWKSLSGMITPRERAGAVTLNGKIYVVGGHNGDECLKSVECYDPKTNCWSQCASLNEARGNPGVTVHNEQIFAVGGCSDTALRTVERYDAQKCVWTKIGSLNRELQVGTISFDSQLWAVGGYDQEDVDCVSVYDEENDKWIDKKPIPLPGFYRCFSVSKALLQS